MADNIKNSCKNPKKIIVAVAILVLVLWGLSYAYFSWSKENPGWSFITKIKTGLNIDSKKDNDINYAFELEWSFSAGQSGQIEKEASLNIKNWEIISVANWLKQKLKLWTIDASIKDSTTENGFSAKGIDLITDSEKTYIYYENISENILTDIEKGYKALKSTWWDYKLFDETKRIVAENKYVMVDDSKPTLKVLWNLANNETIKELAIAMTTSNPEAYLEKHDTYKKLKKDLQNDKFLNYVFKDGQKIDDKTYLMLNSDACNDLAPILETVIKELNPAAAMYMSWDSTANCKQIIEWVNPALGMLAQIYKEGNSETWDIKFVISQGNMLNINLSYKKHNLDTWSINLTHPDPSKGLFTIKWDSNWVKESNLKLNIESAWVKYEADIINWNWKLNISWNFNGIMDLNGYVDFKNYLLSEMDIKGNWEIEGMMKNSFVAKWNSKSWTVSFVSTQTYGEEETEIANFKLDYTNKSYDLNLVTMWPKLTSSYKDGIFNLDWSMINFTWEEKIKLTYDHGKINWELDSAWEKTTITWNLKNYDDFSLEVKNPDYELSALAQKENSNKTNYSLDITESWKKALAINLSSTKSKENNFDVTNLDWKIELENDLTANFNVKLSLQKWAATYSIPTNFEEVEVGLNEMINIPNFNIGSTYNNLSTNQKVMLTWTAWWIVWTVAFISLQWYSQDAKNSKVMADVRILRSAIEVDIAKNWTSLKDYVLRDENYEAEWLTVDWVELVGWENYFVWTINFDTLWQNAQDFTSPWWDDYLIWVVNTWTRSYYQIFGKTTNSYGDTAIVTWNYTKSGFDDTEGLIYYNWEMMTNYSPIY